MKESYYSTPSRHVVIGAATDELYPLWKRAGSLFLAFVAREVTEREYKEQMIEILAESLQLVDAKEAEMSELLKYHETLT